MRFVLRNNLQSFQRWWLKLSEHKEKIWKQKANIELTETKNRVALQGESFSFHTSVEMCNVEY